MNHGILGSPGMKDSIRIDIHQILEILIILTGQHIARAIGIRERIQKGLEGSLEELDKGFFGGILSGSAEDGMFENVGYTGGVGGRGAEGDSEYFVVIIVLDGEEFSPGFLVFVHGGEAAVFCHHVRVDYFVGWVFDGHILISIGISGSYLCVSISISGGAGQG
jgi:hypothetical protein